MDFLKAFKRYALSQCGASAVEFALISPILILIMVGVVDIGFFIKERMQLQNTAQAAAEYAAQMQDDANVETVAGESYVGDFSKVTITSEFLCECSDGIARECPLSCGSGDYQRRFVSVTAVRSLEPLFPYPGIPESLDLQSTVRMRVD